MTKSILILAAVCTAPMWANPIELGGTIGYGRFNYTSGAGSVVNELVPLVREFAWLDRQGRVEHSAGSWKSGQRLNGDGYQLDVFWSGGPYGPNARLSWDFKTTRNGSHSVMFEADVPTPMIAQNIWSESYYDLPQNAPATKRVSVGNVSLNTYLGYSPNLTAIPEGTVILSGLTLDRGYGWRYQDNMYADGSGGQVNIVPVAIDRLAFSIGVSDLTMTTPGAVFRTSGAMNILGAPLPGSTQNYPLLPVAVPGPPGQPTVWSFDQVPSGTWIDPPFVDGFTYQSTGAFFDAITFPNLPAFADLKLTSPDCSATGGLFGSGAGNASKFSFSGAGCSAVDQFTISATKSIFDAGDPAGFPLQVFFNKGSASVTMTAYTNPAPDVPEPGTWALGAAGLAAGFAWRRRVGGA